MNEPLGWIGAGVAAVLVVMWATGLILAYTRGNRSTERLPGTGRRTAGALIGLTGAPLPLFAGTLPRDPVPALMLGGLIVVTQQLAAWLTYTGTVAAWKRVEQTVPDDADPPGNPSTGDAPAAPR